jgi:soluble lytic murein transglycosylase
LSNKARKTYWTYRFQKSIDPKLAEATFQELSSLALPGYYLYLAKSDKGENFQIPATDEKASSSYLEETFEVPSSANKYLNQAEDRLKAGLNKDAALYLNKAVNIVKDNPEKNLLSLLYIAHLYRAAGNHLESMKTFSLLIGGNKNLKPEWTPVLHSEFLEMFPRPFNDKVSWLAREWNIDQDFIYAIMRQESAFNPGAVSATDARGLMQLMPSLARSLSQSWKYQPYSTDKVLFQADENLKLSTYHLYQLQKLAPHYALMAASYNAGLKRTSRWWQKFGNEPLDVFVEFIPVNETRNYVKLVLRNFLYYKALRTGGTLPPNVFAMNLPPYSMPRAVSSIKKR